MKYTLLALCAISTRDSERPEVIYNRQRPMAIVLLDRLVGKEPVL